MRWADIDFPQQTIRLLGKGSKPRLVPLHPALAEHLMLVKRWATSDYVTDTSGMMTNSEFDHRLRRIMRRAGVEPSARRSQACCMRLTCASR